MLSLIGCVPTVDGHCALSVACTDLKELTLGIGLIDSKHKQDLLSVIAQKMRLRLLKLMGTFNEEDAGWFRQRVIDRTADIDATDAKDNNCEVAEIYFSST